MVTNFMDIPDSKAGSHDAKEDNEAVQLNSSVGYSNKGTLQTPDRVNSANMSPNNYVREIIEENVNEEDCTPESAKQSFSKYKHLHQHESFKTNAFESIESFVMLENSLLKG